MKIKKLIGSSIVAISLIGSSAVLAQTDADSKLGGWYGKQFNEKAEVLGAVTTESLITPLIQFNKTLELVKGRISEKMARYQTDTTGAVATNIQGHQDHQVDQLHITSNELKAHHIQAMEVYTEQKKQQEAEEIKKEVEELVSDLTQ